MARTRKNKAVRHPVLFPDSVNLYRFIRLMMGKDIRDVAIARKWRMDQKNFHEFKYGVYPVPRLKRLESLAKILKINKYLLFHVACGASADKVFTLIKTKDLQAQKRLLFGR